MCSWDKIVWPSPTAEICHREHGRCEDKAESQEIPAMKLTEIPTMKLTEIPTMKLIRNTNHETDWNSNQETDWNSNHETYKKYQPSGWQMLREQRSLKGQGLLRKEGPPTYAILSRNLVLSRFFERLSQGFRRKLSCFRRAFNETHPAFVELSMKAILLL